MTIEAALKEAMNIDGALARHSLKRLEGDIAI
jgi:hypothetical protein